MVVGNAMKTLSRSAGEKKMKTTTTALIASACAAAFLAAPAAADLLQFTQTGSGSGTLDVINPATEQVIDTVPAGSTADVDAAVEACRLRLRPILMTTGAMVLGALPLALAHGAGAESRSRFFCPACASTST